MAKITLIFLFSFLSIIPTKACTRIFWFPKEQILTGRTMDWRDSTHPELWLFPRDMNRKGGNHSTSKTWVSKYGSLVMTAYGKAIIDGINEMGLAGHGLYLEESQYSQSPQNTIDSGIWLQYILDLYSTVEEALKDADNWSLILSTAGDHKVSLHFALEDATGDSAIIEFINGKTRIYHGTQHKVLTNAPRYEIQLENLKKFQKKKPPIPGSTHSADRFIRSHYFLNKLPSPKSDEEAFWTFLGLLRTLSTPIPRSATHYRTIIDLKKSKYYFESAQSPNLFWIDLNQIDFSSNIPIKKLDPLQKTLSGDCTNRFNVIEIP